MYGYDWQRTDEMTTKKRLLAAIRGQEVDRLPWAPNMAYWWPNASDQIVLQTEVGFLSSIGADALIRGHYPMTDRVWDHLFLFTEHHRKGEKREVIRQDSKEIRYELPGGTLKAEYTYSASGDTWFLTGHPVKSAEDMKLLAQWYEDMSFSPDYSRWQAAEEQTGEAALIVPLLVPNMKTSFQAMLEYWVGTEELVYALFDYEKEVTHTLEVMRQKHLESVRISAASGAPVFTSWEDTSTTNISPDYYRSYILPEIDSWCSIIHEYGGVYLQHACGTLRHLISDMGSSSIDGIESISPPPTGDIELWEAKASMRNDQVLIGGIEPTVFLSSTIEEFIPYVEQLIKRMEGSRFVLANSDSCPPGVELEKFITVSKLVRAML